MNKYIVPVCDCDNCWVEVINANSIASCQEKLMDKLIQNYEIEEALTYSEFIKNADEKDVIIGNIRDIDEI